MNIVITFAMIVLGYLAGSVSFAIVITYLVTGKDIRKMGNENAGTANVARSIGKVYAAIVFFADVAKAVLPMMLTRAILGGSEPFVHLVVVLVGIAAVLGHCKPVYFGFRGGGGIATTFGALAYVIPFELATSMVLGFVIVQIFVRASEYKLGRWTSGVIALLVPIVTTISALLIDVPISERYRIGGHQWFVIVGVLLAVGFAIQMNSHLFSAYIRSLFGRGD